MPWAERPPTHTGAAGTSPPPCGHGTASPQRGTGAGFVGPCGGPRLPACTISSDRVRPLCGTLHSAAALCGDASACPGQAVTVPPLARPPRKHATRSHKNSCAAASFGGAGGRTGAVRPCRPGCRTVPSGAAPKQVPGQACQPDLFSCLQVCRESDRHSCACPALPGTAECHSSPDQDSRQTDTRLTGCII